MLTTEKIKNFCFDVLGDFVNPKTDLEVEESRGTFRVIVLRTRGIPKDVIRDEWNNQVAGTEFEKVILFI